MNAKPERDPFEFDLGDDLRITKQDRRNSGGGTWVCGTIAGHRFDALVFPEHTESEEYELGTSRISKLWVQRLTDKKAVFNWDRGLDQPAETDLAQAIVDFLAAALNLTNLAAGSKQTVEFRVFSGSLNATKILGWIQVALGLVERAVAEKRMPKWNPGPLKGGWKKAGEGQSEAERLIGYLAWGKGYARLHDGRQFGWISDAISQDAIKNEFRCLAAKNDAQA